MPTIIVHIWRSKKIIFVPNQRNIFLDTDMYATLKPKRTTNLMFQMYFADTTHVSPALHKSPNGGTSSKSGRPRLFVRTAYDMTFTTINDVTTILYIFYDSGPFIDKL